MKTLCGVCGKERCICKRTAIARPVQQKQNGYRVRPPEHPNCRCDLPARPFMKPELESHALDALSYITTAIRRIK